MMKEIIFVKGILEYLNIKFKIPIEVHLYNKLCILISHKPTVKRTKNIDTRYHFIRKYIKDGIIKIEFIQNDISKRMFNYL